MEVERAEWSALLNEFTAVHENWLVSLDILSPDIGAQPAFSNLPLVGATFEAVTGTAVVTAGRGTVDLISHSIEAPMRLWIERTDAGSDVALGIESADGTKTILRLNTAAMPETVDGWIR